jgi:F0F1-type ATP synthase membrane subunit b/b'
MEELHSTETLDREILEDARRKAYRILKTADDTVKTQAETWAKKTQDELDALQKAYQEKLVKTRGEIMARLPLDKRRSRSELAEKLLRETFEALLKGLSREQLLVMLEGELRERFAASTDIADRESGTQVFYHGLSVDEAGGVLKKAANFAGGAELTSGTFHWTFKPMETFRASPFPAIVVDTQDKRIIASIDAAAEALLEDKRAELAESLLGKEALND